MQRDKFPDCIIKYESLDHIGEIKCHRIILSQSGYFNKLFEYEQPDIEICDLPKKHCFHIYKIKIPILEGSLLKCIEILYKEKKYSLEYDIDTIDAISFLILDNKILINSLENIVHKILKSKDYNEKINLIKQICQNINIDIKYKKGVLS